MTHKRRLAVVYDYTGKKDWAVVDMNAALGSADSWKEADNIRKQLEADNSEAGSPAWNPVSGGY